ncbi:nucleotide-binding domain-containing protein [Fictibacillus phosphorivorans]|uniref:nucleotide-binding domain-containing protein n=1 Tax=Fictibacillus phosphorivorans TaxID=1221500 RepID=UPI001293D1BB|nr:nucleotidyltransferase [Fictibacillus phosphorivorans]MQR93715.1 nucleotidyltransferase [Fictibacillus phosphorivorans]
MLGQAFKDLAESLQLDNLEDIDKKFTSITKRLNTSYWDSNSEEDHGYKIGSIGRHTAIKGISDMDMLFILPDHIYSKYNYEGNGQKELLKAVKAEIKKRYPNTIIRGDGQVVVVSFSNYEVEVCPAFEEADASYTYPDSNDGGKWKKTDPLPEIGESEYMIENTNHNFKYVCQMVRAWKNHIGFKMGGLLIDTLVYKFFNKYPACETATFDDYLSLFKDLFSYLKGLDKEQKYWNALGSNQHVYNKDGIFVKKAKEAYDKIIDLDEDSENVYEVLQEVFGKNIPISETIQKSAENRYAVALYTDKQQFIEDIFPVDIRFSLKIDCEVKQNGFRETLLRSLIKQRKPLLINKELTFFITKNEIEEKLLPYAIYWKVRNRGPEAIKRNMLRGEIVSGNETKIERTSFKGGHYVECYIIHNGVCVARDSIDVPITMDIYVR